MSEELKPCDRCGGAAYVRNDTDINGCYWSFVECKGCGLRTRGKWVSHRSNTCPMHYESVREEWNRGANEITALRARVDELEAAIRMYLHTDDYIVVPEPRRSKYDKCMHGYMIYSGCEQCAERHFVEALKGSTK